MVSMKTQTPEQNGPDAAYLLVSACFSVFESIPELPSILVGGVKCVWRDYSCALHSSEVLQRQRGAKYQRPSADGGSSSSSGLKIAPL